MAAPATERLLDDAALRSALRELWDVGGEKRYMSCHFSCSVLARMVAAGFATMDDKPPNEARVTLTVKGRISLAERGG